MSPYSFRDFNDPEDLKMGIRDNLNLYFIFCAWGLCLIIPTLIIKFVACLTFLWKWGHNAFDLVNVMVDTF